MNVCAESQAVKSVRDWRVRWAVEGVPVSVSCDCLRGESLRIACMRVRESWRLAGCEGGGGGRL